MEIMMAAYYLYIATNSYIAISFVSCQFLRVEITEFQGVVRYPFKWYPIWHALH